MGRITSKADQKIEKKIVKIAKDVKKQSVYQRKMAGLNLVKSSMLYVQGDEEEGKEIAKIVASVPMNMILSKIKIQIIAAMGIILPALRPLFCMLLPILLVIVIFSAGVHDTKSKYTVSKLKSRGRKMETDGTKIL